MLSSSLLPGAFLLALSFVPAAGAPSWQPPPPPQSLVFEKPVFDYGEVYQFTAVEHRFPFANQGASPVRILSVTAVSNAGSGRAEPELIPPGGRGEIVVRQPVGNKLGEVSFRFKVATDDPGTPEQKLTLRGFVQSAFDPEILWVDFGQVERDSGASREVEVGSREVAGFRVTGAEGAPAWLLAEPLAAGPAESVRVRLKVQPGASLGAQVGKLRLLTDVPHQRELEVSFRAEIFGDIVPGEATLDLALARIGKVTEKRVALTSRSGRPFEIERIEGAVGGLEVAQEPCASPEGGEPVACRSLILRLSPRAPGSLTGTLLVWVRGQPEPIPLPYGALAVAEDTLVKEVQPPVAGDGAPLPFVPVSKLPPGPSTPPPPLTKREITVKWKATREEHVYGYLVYRAPSRSGPFRRISREVVRVAAPGEPAEYRYVDRDVAPGETYYYYLDTVSRAGAKQRFSGVLSRSVAADAAP